MAATMDTDVEKRNKRSRKGCRRNSPQRIEAALTALVLNGGNVVQTAEQLGIPQATLGTWKESRRELYQRIQQERAPELERLIAHQARQFILAAGQAESHALTATLEALANGNVKDPSATLRNLSVSKAVNIDKMLAVEGRPTSVIEHRGDPLKRLENQGFVNSTASELPSLPDSRTAFSGKVEPPNAREPGQLVAGEGTAST